MGTDWKVCGSCYPGNGSTVTHVVTAHWLTAISLFPTVFPCRLGIAIPVMVNRIGARGAHTGASPTCLDRLKQKWRDEMGTEGLLNDDEARTEACMLPFPAG